MALRWGICSAGWISVSFTYSVNILNQAKHKVVAVAARDLSKAQKFAKDFNIPKAYGSYQQLADDKNVDVVYIGTIHTEHLRLCLMFLEAGKHVLCEKPCTMNKTELLQVLSKAKEKKLFFMEAIWPRFLPVYDQIRTEIANKSIGDVKMLNVIWSNMRVEVARMNRRESGGGGLMDASIYGIQLASLLFKEKPTKVHAVGHLLDSGVDHMVSITLMYGDDRMAHITVSISSNTYTRGIISGTTGEIEIPHPYWGPSKVITPTKEYDFPMPTSSTLPPPDELLSTGYVYEIEEVRRCINGGLLESPVVTHKEMIMMKEILDEARRQVGVKFDQDCV